MPLSDISWLSVLPSVRSVTVNFTHISKVKNVDIPAEASYIDLSDNNIDEVDLSVFLSMELCERVELRYNKISAVDLTGIEGLDDCRISLFGNPVLDNADEKLKSKLINLDENRTVMKSTLL